MGKPKHKDHRKENDSDSDNDDDIINIVAERLGKAIWEVTEADIAAYKNEDSETKVFLRADRNVSWGRVVQILKSVKSAGFPNIFLVTTEETFQ